MGEKTKIEWTDATWNPWRGCQKVSPGCQNCYAEKQAKRNPSVLGIWGPHGTRVIASDAAWKQPLAWNRKAAREGVRRRVFCGSMCDVFEDRPELKEPRSRLFWLIHETPHLDWLLLSKRPENAGLMWNLSNPLPENVWVGTSVENQEAADKRIPELLKIPARVRFLSCEPLLGPIDLQSAGWHEGNFDPEFVVGVDWVIVGGESGPKARPCHVEWVRSIVRQCRAVGVPAFVKQLGSCPIIDYYHDDDQEREWALSHRHEIWRCDHWLYTLVDPAIDGQPPPMSILRFWLKHHKGGDKPEWPEDLRVQEWPVAAGSQHGKERDDAE